MKKTNWRYSLQRSPQTSTAKQQTPRTSGLLSFYRQNQIGAHRESATDQVQSISEQVRVTDLQKIPSRPQFRLQHKPSFITSLASQPSPETQNLQLPPDRNRFTKNVFCMQPHSVWTSTFTVVRRWSNKMAAIVGYVPAPSAPYMDRYHPQVGGNLGSQARTRPWKRSRTLRIAWQMRLRRDRWQQTQPSFFSLCVHLFVILAVLLIVSSLSGTAYAYTYYRGQLPRLQELARQHISQSSRIYDRHGTLLYEFFTNHRRTPITYNDVPQVMRDAMVAAEDKTFWTNTGLDPQGILRASLAYLNAGHVQGGGSTLTQQLVKNLTDDKAQTLNRKLPEAALALSLTRQYPKSKILEMYFNIASFNNSDYGIEAAVEDYFHLQPKCDSHFHCIPGIASLDYNARTGRSDPLLSLARASLLAGMPQNPSLYDPTLGESYKQAALARQQYVLTQMAAMNVVIPGLGPLTPALQKRVQTLTAQMVFAPMRRSKLAPHFVDWIITQLATALGAGNYENGYTALATGGFNIRTTIDLSLERYVEQAVTRHLTQPEYQPFIGDYGPLNTQHNVNDSAVVVINAHTGEILAMNGSADYYSTDPRVGGYYNAAASGTGRPVGSTFKPFVYATAFQMGWYPAMVLPDNLTYVPNGAAPGASIYSMYEPTDHGPESNHHEMTTTIRRATSVSWNIAAVKAGAFVGASTLLTNVQRMGLTHITDTHASWVLGTNNATVLEMTGAYQTFANGGMHIPPQGVLDIWDNYGHNLYHYDVLHLPTIRVFSPQVAYLMTSILIDQPSRSAEFLDDYVLSFADIDRSCISLRACSHQVAAKTGTTNAVVNGIEVIPDNWTVGYTPNAVVGVWSGNANNAPMYSVVGITGAAPIWHSVISTVTGHCPQDLLLPCPAITPHDLGLQRQSIFTIPAGISPDRCTSPITGLAPGNLAPETSMHCDWMIDGQMPWQTGLVAPIK